MNIRILGAAALALAVAGCSWGIRLGSDGQKVRVAWDGRVEGCRDAGTITVSVLDSVGPVARRDLKVRDELEVMARNEAAALGADTVRPLGEPQGGSQRWSAHVCGPAAPPPAGAPGREDPPSGTETFPIGD